MLDFDNLLDYNNKKLFFKDIKPGNGLIFAQRAAEKWRVDGFVDQFVAGSKDIGKTAYTLYNLKSCYGNWTDALNHLVFDPKIILQLFDVVNDLDIKVPMVAIDDAATHLAKSTWYETDTLNFSKLYNVVRSVASSVIMNAPSEKIPASIANDIKYITKIKKLLPMKIIKNILKDRDDEGYSLWNKRVNKAKMLKLPNPYSWRKAVIYHKIVYPSGKIIIASDHDTDIFPQQYPDEVHDPYKVLRRGAVKKLIGQCLHPELYEKSSTPGRKPGNIEISKAIYYSCKALEAQGFSQRKIWAMLNLTSRDVLINHIMKWEGHLKQQAIQKEIVV